MQQYRRASYEYAEHNYISRRFGLCAYGNSVNTEKHNAGTSKLVRTTRGTTNVTSLFDIVWYLLLDE